MGSMRGILGWVYAWQHPPGLPLLPCGAWDRLFQKWSVSRVHLYSTLGDVGVDHRVDFFSTLLQPVDTDGHSFHILVGCSSLGCSVCTCDVKGARAKAVTCQWPTAGSNTALRGPTDSAKRNTLCISANASRLSKHAQVK